MPEVPRPDPADIGLDPAVNLLQAFVQTRAKETELASEVVASRGVLKALVKGGPDRRRADGHRHLDGWRGEVLGAPFLELLAGRASMGLDPVTRRVRWIAAAG